jgi:Bacterial pre-peptidase C-terminal domain
VAYDSNRAVSRGAMPKRTIGIVRHEMSANSGCILMTRLIPLVLIAAIAILPSAAQDKKKPAPKKEPRVFFTVPLGAAPGKTTKLTLRGSNLEDAKDVKILDGKGSAKILSKGKAGVPDKNPEKVGDTQVEIELKLNDKLAGDSVSLVVVTANGETKPHAVLIETILPVVLEKEPNDGFRSAQVVTLPIVIEGAIGRPKDVDLFRFEGKKGQKLYTEVLASRHGSPLDSMLTLYDAKGEQLAANDDFTKDHRDAKLEFVLPADGTYYLSLIDVHDTGSALHVYRLVVK